ncbi:aminotransferase-like domain-containing protein [Photobacterium swingsii]|uniref:aminotransferase-like domain-containing protein n=1 Tax=Photobacterium swingsii TaxID=680026 RepID=UPI00406800D4
MFIPQLPSGKSPKFLQIANAFEKAIINGILKEGTKLPSQRILSYKLNTTVGTITRSYSELEARGLVEGKVGSGTYVINKDNSDFYTSSINCSSFNLSICQPVIKSQSQHLKNALISLATSSSAPMALLNHYSVNTMKGHEKAINSWVNSKFSIDVHIENIMWTYGGQHGLSLVINSLSRPKDKILAEELCYPQFKEACKLAERKTVGVKIDNKGLIPEDLMLKCKRHRPKLLYLTPNVQNPTGVQLTEERRLKIINICRAYDVIIIEDDVLFCPFQLRKTPIFKMAPDITVYIGSFSKHFSGGVRAGFLIYPHNKKQCLINALRSSCIHISPIILDLVSRWLIDGTMEKVEHEINNDLKHRHDIFKKIFHDEYKEIKGFNVLLHTPPNISGFRFSKILSDKGIKVRCAREFIINNDQKDNFIRLSLTSESNSKNLEKALKMIKKEILRHQ